MNKHLFDVKLENVTRGNMVNVIVSKNGKLGEKTLKVCKINSRTVLFIEVDKPNRKNIFRKIKVKDIAESGMDTNNVLTFIMKDGVLLSENKWESAWDSISTNPVKMSPYGRQSLTRYSSYMKPSTTNSPAGFPIV
jgi:hypothetical protein